MRILSIDAWADGDGWSWNQWWIVGEITKEEFEAITDYAQWFVDNGYIEPHAESLVDTEDDQYNIVLFEKENGMPIYAIEYGPEY